MVPSTSTWPAWPIITISQAFALHAPDLGVDLGDQRAGGVDDAESACFGGGGAHRGRDTVGAVDELCALRRLLRVLDEDGALLAQAVDHVAVVHDLVAYVDGPLGANERALDDLDGPVHAGAETPGAGEQHCASRTSLAASALLRPVRRQSETEEAAVIESRRRTLPTLESRR